MNVIMQLPKQLQEQDIAFSYWMKEAPDNKFVVTAFAVDEAIFGMTKIEVMLSSKDDHIDLQALMDSPGTLTVHHKYLDTPRHFSGIVVEAERGDKGHHRTAYRLVLMPSLFRLDYGSDCRIFQQKKVTDIVKEIFSEHGIENVTWGVDEGKHEMREYCVQYRESHLAFVERILAEEGIFYYFEHDSQGQLTLVVTDRPSVLHDCPGQKEIEYNALASGAVKGVYCSSLNYREKLRSTTMVQRDYTFRNPEYSQEHKEKTSTPNGEKKDYELYDYPGRYKKDAAGKPFTRYKLEATRVDASLGYGISNAPHLITGHAITLEEHPDKKLNQKWRLLTIRHEGVQPQSWSEDGQGNAMPSTQLAANGLAGTQLSGLAFGTTSSQSPNLLNQTFNRGVNLALQSNTDNPDVRSATLYANAFTVQASMLPYRPPQTVKPLIDGPQIAIVVGPPGEEIFTDEYGRVKVHFPWDRHKNPKAEDSSCWMRVSQAWGGGEYGNVSIPRIGHEVIVDFLEGDPDQPLIMGRTYHEKNASPYKLPDHKTKMAIRSNSHKGDGGFNELSFEDEKGQENMFLHAEKDQTVKIKNNQMQRIDANAIQNIGKNQAIEVGNNANHQIGGGMNMVVGAIGSAATGLIGNVLQGLMGQSAGLLQQGMSIATQAIAASAAKSDNGSSKGGQAISQAAGATKQIAGAAGQAAKLASAIPDKNVQQAAQAVSSAADNVEAASQAASEFSSLLSGGGVVGGMAAIAQGFDSARSGANEAKQQGLRSSGGASMASAGRNIAQSVAGMVGGGIMNQLVSKITNRTSGVASTEQVGQVKVTTVGQVHTETVGTLRKIQAGEEFSVSVGPTADEKGNPVPPKAMLVMKSDGTILLKGEKIFFEASGPIKQTGKVIDLN